MNRSGRNASKRAGRPAGDGRGRDWLQFDCALSYGLVEYLRTLDMLERHGPTCIA
jgi:hypothetical protein